MKRPIGVLLLDDRIMGEEYIDNLPIEERGRVILAIRRAFDMGESESIEYRDFDETWWQVSVVPIERAGRVEKAAIVSTDITERKRAEGEILQHQKRLRSLASESSLAEEKERKRISTGLHDRIGQPLLALKMMMGSLRKSIKMPELVNSIDEMENLLGRTIEDTRALTFELSPQILYILGFEAAIEWLAEQSEKRYGFPIEFQSDRKSKPLDNDLQVFLFQAVRELLCNVGKHSCASKARVTISRSRDAKSVNVRVTDNGVGFDVFKIDRFKDGDKDFGLFSIRERLYHLGGSFRMKSEPGQGTKIALMAPLKSADKINSREAATT